ncbi:MAG: flagellar hook-basal body complex protein FliE [Gracilibacteraceae bacterium]|jgi:flagellar hook-basal body complex protein FliE|nr:flagellar hook-basal body complex protein FliE [Gracilibacteraceae bacterium]
MNEVFLSQNFINPLEQFAGAAPDRRTSAAGAEGQTPFADIFRGLVETVDATSAIEEAAALAAASGDVDQLHTLTIASVKADLALQLFVQLRNKAHDAYSEIMRMGT